MNVSIPESNPIISEHVGNIPELVEPGMFFKDMPNPTIEDQQDPSFEAIWTTIKKWDVNVPDHYNGYCGANGSHVMLILNALRRIKEDVKGQIIEEVEGRLLNLKYRGVLGQEEVVAAIEAANGTWVEPSADDEDEEEETDADDADPDDQETEEWDKPL